MLRTLPPGTHTSPATTSPRQGGNPFDSTHPAADHQLMPPRDTVGSGCLVLALAFLAIWVIGVIALFR